MKTINTERMRKRALAAQPAARRDRWEHAVFERCGYACTGDPDASLIVIRLRDEVFTQYAMRRAEFDAMDDEEFAARMKWEKTRWGVDGA